MIRGLSCNPPRPRWESSVHLSRRLRREKSPGGTPPCGMQGDRWTGNQKSLKELRQAEDRRIDARDEFNYRFCRDSEGSCAPQ